MNRLPSLPRARSKPKPPPRRPTRHALVSLSILLGGLGVTACGVFSAVAALGGHGGLRAEARFEPLPQGLPPGLVLPWVIGFGGASLSALLALSAWLLLSGRERAQRIAAEMTADLQRMARVVERTSSAVYGLDLAGRITWANAGFERLTGLAAEECVGRFAIELSEVAGADRASRRSLQRAIAQREPRRLELRNQMREGVHYWTDTELQPTRDAEGQVNGFICIASDITQRKLAEMRLRDSEHLMRVIADNLPARVSYWDRDRRCRFVNRRFCEVYGRLPDQLKGREISPEIFGQDFYERLRPHVDRVLQGQPQYFEYHAPAGSLGAGAWQLHYIPDIDAGEVKGFFVLALDVTELRQARDVAVQASQSKSRFLSSMSHEIRTPLNAVLGMLALLRGTAMDGRQRDYAEKAERAARSLLSLLNDILDLSKIEAGKMALAPRPFAVDELLRDLSVIFAGSRGSKPLEVRFELDPLLPPRLVADDLRLRQVLINLGGNAIKFTEAGEVVLTLRVLERRSDQVRLEVSVRDTGTGIPAQAQERIFSDFGQAHPSTAREYGGTGLGLGICRKLLGLMGSQLRLESAPGQGSRFWFDLTLPIAIAPTEPPPEAGHAEAGGPAAARHAAPSLAGLRLLLVEDNPTNQQVALELLAMEGAQVEVASNGREGLARIREEADRFDAVLMDVLMPEMDGHAATRAVREQLGNWRLPIIAMTANALESDRLECLAAGMNDHIGKPFGIDDLVATLLRHVQPQGAPAAAASRQATGGAAAPLVPAGGCVIDRVGAVGRLGGDEALYERLLPSFTESLAGISARLPTLLDSIPQSEAVRLMHSLKGSAATMGADRLAAVAAGAERLLSRAQPPQEDAQALRAVAQAIEQTLFALGDARDER